MNDDLNRFGDTDYLGPLDSSAKDFYGITINDGIVVSKVVVDKTDQLREDQLRELLDNLKNTEAEEYIDIVIEFLRRRLEAVLDNPDMVDNLDKLRKLDSLDLDLANRVLYLETEVDSLRASLSNVTTKLDKLLEILKNGQEELKYL